MLGAHKMEAVFICAHNPALNVLQVHVTDNLDAPGKSLRTNGSLVKTRSLKLFVGKQGKAIYHALCLDFIQFVIAGDKESEDSPLGVLAHHSLNRGSLFNAEELRKAFDGGTPGVSTFLHSAAAYSTGWAWHTPASLFAA